MQDVYNTITAKCFNKCVAKPGDRLDKGENTLKSVTHQRKVYKDTRKLVRTSDNLNTLRFSFSVISYLLCRGADMSCQVRGQIPGFSKCESISCN
jgi:hypothetical protein